jgi:toxin ParE1/3/4
MFKFRWSEKAAERISGIADYIALDAPHAANKWISLILSKEKLIIDNPKIGRVVPEIGKESVREILVGQYRLIYEIEENKITVHTVMNCRELLHNITYE